MDVAALALSVDSTDVVKATADLDKFSAASDKAAGAAGKLANDGSKAAPALSHSGQAAASAAASVDRYAGASMGAGAAAAQAAQAAMRSAQGATASGAAARASGAGWDMLTGTLNSNFVAINKNLQALNLVPASAGRARAAMNDNVGAMKANTGNIAAQFQDIGVTAAMGMNPMLIAFQQGPQLSAAFAGGGLKSLGAALRSVISPMSLLTIAVVAGAAALIQLVDWSKLAQGALNGLADILVTIAPYAVTAAAALALIYSPAIIAGIATLTKGFIGLAASMLATIPIPVLIVAGLTAIVAAANYWRDDLTRIFGVDIVAAAKGGINFIVGGFVGAYNTIIKVWQNLPDALGDAAYTAANRVKGELNDLFKIRDTATGESHSLFNFDTGKNPYAGALREVGAIAQATMSAAQNVDYVGKAIKGVTDLAQKGADKLRGWTKALGAVDDKKKTGAGGASGATAAPAVTPQADPWGDLLADADKQQRALDQAGARVGVYGEALATLTHQQELFNAAQDKGIPITAKVSAELNTRAASLGATEYANLVKATTEANDKAYADAMRQLDQQRGALGLTGAALQSYNYVQQAINAELQKGVALKDIDIAKIQEQGDAYGAARDSIEKTTQAISDAREITTGFFSDFYNGLRQGEGLFKSFEKAVTNALDRIIQKLIETAIEQMFFNSLLGAAGGGGGSGILGLVVNLFGGGGGGLSSSDPLAKAFDAIIPNALGATFGTAQRFANGGAFTNQIISSPTLFRFAKGSKMGLMGEEGPEAIMPLARGPNGKLGVQAHGGGDEARGRPIIRMGDVHVSNSLAGAIGPEGLAIALQQSGERTVAQIRRDLQSMLQQLDADGTLM